MSTPRKNSRPRKTPEKKNVSALRQEVRKETQKLAKATKPEVKVEVKTKKTVAKPIVATKVAPVRKTPPGQQSHLLRKSQLLKLANEEKVDVGDNKTFNGLPIASAKITSDSIVDIALNCQIQTGEYLKLVPEKFVYENLGDPIIQPAVFSAYLALCVLEIGREKGLFKVDSSVGNLNSVPFVSHDSQIPIGLAFWATNYWRSDVGPIYERYIKLTADWALATSAVSKAYAPNSFSNIQDPSNAIFNQTYALYNIEVRGAATPGGIINTPTSISGFFTGTTAFVGNVDIQAAYSEFIKGSLIESCTISDALTMAASDGSAFCFPAANSTITGNITWLNANNVKSPFSKFDPDLSIVYTPTTVFTVGGRDPFEQAFVESLPFPVQPYGGISDTFPGQTNCALNRVAEHLQKYYYLTSHGTFSGGVSGIRDRIHFKKRFQLYGLALPDRFSKIIPYSFDYFKYMRIAIHGIYQWLADMVKGGANVPSTFDFSTIYQFCDMLFKAKIQYCGQPDSTYSMGAFTNVCSLTNFLAPIAILDQPLPPFLCVLIREVGVSSFKKRIYVPFMNQNFSSNSTVANATVISGINTLLKAPVVAAMGGPLPPGYSSVFTGSTISPVPQYPNVPMDNPMIYGTNNDGLPIPNGAGVWSPGGTFTYGVFNQTNSNFLNTLNTAPAVDTNYPHLVSLFTCAPGIIACFDSFFQLGKVNKGGTLTVPPSVNTLGGPSTVGIVNYRFTNDNQPFYQVLNMQILTYTGGFIAGANVAIYNYFLANAILNPFVTERSVAAQQIAIGCRSFYNGNDQVKFIYPTFTTLFIAEAIESELLQIYLDQMNTSESAFLTELMSNYDKEHTAGGSNQLIVTSRTTQTDCIKSPLKKLGNLASGLIKSPKTPIYTKKVCQAGTAIATIAGYGPVAKYVNCDMIESGIKALQGLVINATSQPKA
jgi:hypothetical protein